MTQRQPLVVNASAGGEGVQQMQSGDTLAVINGGRVKYRGSVAVTTGTTQIPLGAAAPLSTGGTAVWTQSITPTVVGSTLDIDFTAMVDTSVNTAVVTMALFVGTTLLAFVQTGCYGLGVDSPGTLKIAGHYTTTSLSAVSISCRVGLSATGTWYLGRPESNTMGGTNPSFWSIVEEM